MSDIIIKTGKSRKVEIYDNFVIKNPILDERYSDENIREIVFFACSGELENLKEIYLWEFIKNNKFISDSFANIIDFDVDTTQITAEKLTPVNNDKFYLNFVSHIKIFRAYFSHLHLDIYTLLDNHTLDNSNNYGLDNNGNLKILDYAPNRIFIQNIFNSDFNLESFINLKEKIKKDIRNKDFNEFIDIDILKLNLFAILLKSYKSNIYITSYRLWKFNFIKLKNIPNFIKFFNKNQ
jgi:hypothetical protein